MIEQPADQRDPVETASDANPPSSDPAPPPPPPAKPLWQRVVQHPLALLVWYVTTLIAVALVVMRALALLPSERPARLAGLVIGQCLQQSITIAAAVVVALFIERTTLTKAGLGPKGMIKETAIGYAMGAGLMSLIVAVMALFGWYRLESFGQVDPEIAGGLGPWGLFAWSLFFWFIVGLGEEVMFRAVAFRYLEQCLGTILAIALSGLLFGLFHIGNKNSSLQASLAIAIEAGVLFGAIFALTRRVWMVAGVHWAWNMWEGTIYGLPVSGETLPWLGKATETGPAILTGGAFGPESGLLCILVCGGAGIAAMELARRQGKLMAPSWRRKASETTAGPA